MKKVFIFDDNKEHLLVIKNKIEKYKSNKFNITCFVDSKDLIDNISRGNFPDILFMDIVDEKSPDTGIDIVKEFLKDSPVEIIYIYREQLNIARMFMKQNILIFSPNQ